MLNKTEDGKGKHLPSITAHGPLSLDLVKCKPLRSGQVI